MNPSLINDISRILEGRSLEEVGNVAEALAVLVITEMPDRDQAVQSFMSAIMNSIAIVERIEDCGGQETVQ